VNELKRAMALISSRQHTLVGQAGGSDAEQYIQREELAFEETIPPTIMTNMMM